MIGALALAALAVNDGRDVVELVCLDCHSGDRAEAKFDVASMLDRPTLAESLFDWRRARAMVESNAMPPPPSGDDAGGDDAVGDDAGGLDADERAEALAFFDAIEAEALEEGGAAGHEPARRLTRTELGHALRDLLGVEIDVEALMPDELVAENAFETNAATLFVHPEWLQRADVAVRVALDAALPAGDAPASLDPSKFEAATFLRRAYRRPPTADEVARVESTRAARVADGADARGALRAALFEALASPHFRLRLEDAVAPGDAVEAVRPVGAFGLASRLSFFLWAAPPDDALLDLAASGALDDPEVLDAEIARLLADPRALDFARVFAGQWLGTRKLGREFKPDPIDVAFMTDSLMASMRDEVARFIHMLVAEDRPLDDLLRSDVTFVDGELARFYRMKRVRGDAPIRVRVTDPRRRGLLGKAAILACTSYPERTSPVLRGAWILDDLLGTPPPPPPPGASEVSEEVEERAEEEGPRALLELHRASVSCASCHDRIDPLGFALDGFDQFGRTRGRGRDDVRGALPGGDSFHGPSGLSRVLLETRRADLAREIARRMLAYALARPLDWRDERTVVELARTLEADGFGALVRAIALSRPFRFVDAS